MSSYKEWYNSLSWREKCRKNAFNYIDRLTDWFYDKTESHKRDYDFVYELSFFLQKVVCFILGHSPVSDQCNIPAHDYCAYCQKSLPGCAKRA